MNKFMLGFNNGLFIWLLLIVLSSCSAQQNENNDENNEQYYSEIYESCCGVGSQKIYIEGDSVLVPNVFTPNGDGINDYFYPILSNPEINVVGFSIYWDEPWSTTRVIFSRDGLVYSDIENYGYDGKIYLSGQWKEEHEGSFLYRFWVVLGTKSVKVEGKACVVRCNEDAKVFRTKSGCYFQSQINNYDFDLNLPNQEEECFGK